MFQYAFYLALRQDRPQTKIDPSIFSHRPSHNGYELERVFGVQAPTASPQERNQMADVSKDWFSELRRALGITRTTTGQLIIEPDPAKGWRQDLLHVDNAYLQGYWQSEKYFLPVVEQVRDAFVFLLPLPETETRMAQQMSDTQSVSVHIRRGDYLKARRRADYEVCTETYYRRAVKYVQAHVNNPRFYVFSDEPAWGRTLGCFPKETVFVSGHTGENAYIDMQLMTCCRHHIIANSSFSWWGAWLGEYKDSIILAPNTWFRLRPRPDIIPDRWIQIDVN